VDAINVNEPERPRRAERIAFFGLGALAGAAGLFLALNFPGGRGEGRRLELSFREGREYRVRRVVDGDTVVIEPGVYLRYAGINTPETREVVEVSRPFGPEATAANRALVEGRSVRLRFGAHKLDRYGRLLACVEVRDPETGEWIDVGEELARRGLARPIYKSEEVPNREKVGRAVSQAREARRGVWSLAPPR
jgi:endonuclease YncB( thermonuclease family)